MKLRVYIILFFTFFGVAHAQTFSSPNLYIDNSSVLTNQVSICTQTVTIVAKLTVADSNGISSSEIPTPSIYYGNYNTTQVDIDFSQWSLETGDYYNGTYTATLTIDPSSFMAGKYGLKYGTWRTSTSSRYGYYDGALILKNECSTSIPMYHYKFEDDITNSGVGSNGNGTNNDPSWSWSFTDDRFSVNKSLSLNGSMYVDLNNNLKLKTSYNQGITLSAWVYIENNTSVDSFRYIVDLTDGYSNNNWDSRVLMALTSSSTIKLGTNHNGVLDGSQDLNIESLSVNSGEWINVVGVWDLDNDELSIYINGTQQNNSTNISSINSLDLYGGASGGGSKRIGQRVFSDSNSSGWIGKIDDVKFYNTALTSSTILNLYNANKADSVAPTVVLSDTDSDNIVSNSDVVTITATFSESMAATPTISLSGINSEVLMAKDKGIKLQNSSLWNTNEPNNSNSGTEAYGMLQFYGDALNDTTPGHSTKYVLEFNSTLINSISGFTYLGEYNNHNYFYSNSSFTWENANQDAINNGGYLAVINEKSELDFLNSFSYSGANIGVFLGFYQDTTDPNYSEPDGGWKWVDDSSSWSYSWTVSTAATSTTAMVSGTDLAGNAYTGADSITFTIDNSNPSLTIIKPKGTYTNQSVVVTLTYDEAVTGLTTDTSQFSEATNIASLTLLSVSSDYKTYTVRITPSSDGLVKLTHAPNSPPVIDSAGNPIASTVSCSFIYDATSPKVTLTDSDSDNIVVNSDVVTITVVFDELVSDPSLMLYNGSSSLLSSNTLTVSDSLIFSNYWRKKPDGSYENPENDGGNENYAYMGYIQNTSHYQNGLITFVDYRSGQDALHYIIETSSSLSSIQSHTYIGTFQDSNYFTSNVKTSNIEQTISELNGLGYRLLTIETNSEYNYFKTLYSSSQIINDNNPYWIGLIQNTSSSNYSEPSGGWEWIKLEAKQWEYSLTISTTLPSITAKVSATDLAGNAYSGTDSITFTIDNTTPTVTLTDTDSDNIVSNSDVVTITATFSESMAATPTFSLSGIVSNAQMSATTSDTVWTYTWTVSTTVTSTTATVSGTDLVGNAYSGSDNILFTIDNIPPEIEMTSPAGYVYLGYYDKHLYFINSGTSYGPKLNWAQANSAANSFLTDFTLSTQKAEGGLVIIDSSDENDFIGSLLSDRYFDNSVWTGIYQDNDNSSWINRLGESQTYFSWRSDQPSGTNQNAVLFTADPSVQSSSFASESNVWTDEDSLNSNDYIVEIDNFYFEDNANSAKISFYASMETLTWSLSGDDANFFEIDDSDQSGAAQTIFIDFKSSFKGNITHSNPQDANSDNIYSLILNVSDIHSNTTSIVLNFKALDTSSPTVNLTDTDSDNIVSNSDVVTITATFSESMSATPTLSLSGITSNAQMSATTSDTIWTYAWTVSGSTVTSTTATVSGTDLSGNTYAGTDSITFTIDNSNPTLVSFTDNDTYNIVNDYTNVTFTATFSESMATSPALSISGLVTNTAMTVSASTNSTTWTYFWDVPSGSDGTYFATVSGTDLLGNVYSGTESITFIIDNTDPLIQSVTVTDTNSKVLLTYNEPVQLYDPSYFATNFSVIKTGGTATVSYTGYSFSTTDSNTIILNIIVTGEPTGDELLEVGPAGASTLIDKAGNYAMDYSDSNQTSNTVYLTNTPPKFSATTVNSNNTSITIVFNENVTADASGTELSNTDFTLAVSGGAAVLASATPIALSKTDSKTYVLLTSYSVPSNGSEILTVTPISSAVFDSKGTQINLSATQSNTVQLNDQAGPSITGAALDSQNRYVDITFSEGVYATSSPTTAVKSSSFTISQRSGPSYGMTISSITTTGGGVLSGGETTLRFNLGSTVKPTGQEVFAITATDSSSVVDVSGNSMTASQTNNTFQLKPPTSGGVSPEKSTISAAPAQMIGNGINTAVITVQAKDSLGQNFLEGGYQITLFGPNGDLTTTDNQNGTYSASYTPDAITQDFEELTFGFRVATTNGTNTALLRLYLDEDGDGVYNINDACLGTETGLEVDATGCALNQLDSDNDGVFDDLDECPDTPEFEINNVKGTPTFSELIPTVVDEKGCGASQRDTDGDGIVDTEDNCIETANADQADADGDGIGDVCDTDNPLPEITTTEIKFVQLPQNGTTVGKIEATDPDGEALTFSQSGDNFTGVLSIASDGSITVSSGALLTFDSAYNGASLGFTVSDGENDVPGFIKILIEDVPRPPEISIITLEISEDAEVGTIVGFVEAKDPMGGQILSISLQGDGFIELVDGVLKTTQELDYETTTAHPFTITAQASDRSDGPGLSGSKSESIRVADIPNATYTGRFFISIFNVDDEALGAKVDHTRYFNPHNKNVGKWKVKKKIKGGADADKFTIKSRSNTAQKNGNPVDEETEDYLDFITPPDFENPGDANRDNIYEVEIEYINTDDGAPEVPIVVTQTNIQVPEGKSRTIELQAQPVLPTDDNDGDGVVDILDNSPLVANPDQSDEDGDGVGDVTDDFDHDGVWNPFDTCPDTPLGDLVDIDGCLIYYLPASNFSISKTEKCIGENRITIDVIDTTVDYNVTVSGATNAAEVFTGSSWSLENLSSGEYTLCIGVEGVNPLEFERCFKITIEESDPLLVSSLYNKENQTVSFDLSGGSAYQITHNGKTTQTSSSKHTVQLDKGINNISISTGIECQGLFENTYLNSYEVKYAPNPFKDELQLFIGGKDNLFEIGVYSSNGQLIDYQTVSLSFGMRNYSLNTSSYKQGVYIIKIKGHTLDQSIQVIKE